MSRAILRGLLITACLACPALARAQTGHWAVAAEVGNTWFVDDASKGFLTTSLSGRRYVTPRLAIGPEVVVMAASGQVRDRNVMLTVNLFADLAAPTPTRRVMPFVVAGGGLFWARDQIARRSVWSREGAFTAGAGLRGRLAESVAFIAEYRVGWELHHRVTAGISLGGSP